MTNNLPELYDDEQSRIDELYRVLSIALQRRIYDELPDNTDALIEHVTDRVNVELTEHEKHIVANAVNQAD